VPHLSEQDFNVTLNILNVQSYPVVGGNWEVEFETLGEANLTIRAINGTTCSKESDVEDLRFLEILCGDEVKDYEWINGSVFVEGYSCDETGREISRVWTTGEHYLEFQFGDEFAYALNDASDAYDNLSQTYMTTFNQQLAIYSATVLNISVETLIDEGYTHVSGASRVYVNSTDKYKISYGCTFDNADVGSRAIMETWVRKNGATEIVPSRTACYSRTSNTDSDRCSNQGVLIASLNEGDYLEVVANQTKQESTGYQLPYTDCNIYIQRVRRPVAQIYDSTGGGTYTLGGSVTVNLDAETYTDSRVFTADTANDEIEIDLDSW